MTDDMNRFVVFIHKTTIRLAVFLTTYFYYFGLMWAMATDGQKVLYYPPMTIGILIYVVAAYGLFFFKNYGRIFFVLFLFWNLGLSLYDKIMNIVHGRGGTGIGFELWMLKNDLFQREVFVALIFTAYIFLLPAKKLFKK